MIPTIERKILGVILMDQVFKSEPLNVDSLVTVSADLLWSGSDADTELTWQGSNDGVNFKDVPLLDAPIPEITLPAGSGHEMINWDDHVRFPYRLLRFSFNPLTSTIGTLTVVARTKLA